MPTAYHIPNPFDALARHSVTLPAGTSVAQAAASLSVTSTATPTVCAYRDGFILPADWHSTHLGDGDGVTFIRLPADGGDDNKTLRTVLTLAISLAVPYAVGVTGAGAATATFGQVALSTALVVGGSALVNALLPVDFGETVESGTSPTYTTGATNRARPGGTIPLAYGRNRLTPDVIAPAWQFWDEDGETQIARQIFCLGIGEFNVEQVLLDDTPIGNFDNVRHEIIAPGGGDNSIYSKPVFTSAEFGTQTLPGDQTPATAVTIAPANITVDRIQVDLSVPRVRNTSYFRWLETDGAPHSNQYRLTNIESTTWDVVVGTEPDRDGGGDRIETRTAFEATAVYHRYVAAQHRTAEGEPWRELGRADVPFVAELQQGSVYIDVPATAGGQWRIAARYTAISDGEELLVGAVRARASSAVSTRDDVTLLALETRATQDNRVGAGDRVRVIATRKVPVWNEQTGWVSPIADRSIPWALADFAKARHGGGLSDAHLDLPALSQLNERLTARGDTFNAVFDTRGTAWRRLNEIARAGRATCVMAGGRLHVVRDEPKSVPAAMFTPRNIVAGSFRLTYNMPSEATAGKVRLEYLNEETWSPSVATAAIAGAGERETTISMRGVTDAAQAAREAQYTAAANVYRRIHVSFRTELEGLAVQFGDLIAVAHDTPRWGQSGEVLKYWVTGGQAIAILSEPVDWDSGDSHVIRLARRDNSPSNTIGITRPDNALSDNEVLLASTPDEVPYTGDNAERTRYVVGIIGEDGSNPKLARVAKVIPRAANQIEIVAVVEDERVHAV